MEPSFTGRHDSLVIELPNNFVEKLAEEHKDWAQVIHFHTILVFPKTTRL